MSQPDNMVKEPSLLALPLGWITRLVLRVPKLTLVLACGFAVAALYVTILRLEMHTDRLDLLNPKSTYNKLWLGFIAEFGADDDAVVVVEGVDKEAVVPVLDALSAELRVKPELYHTVLEKVDLSPLRRKRLHYLSPRQLAGLESILDGVRPFTVGDWSGLNMTATMTDLAALAGAQDPQIRAAAAAKLSLHSENLLGILSSRDAYQSPWSELSAPEGIAESLPTQYMLGGDGRIGLVLLRLADGGDSFARGSRAIDQLRELLAEFSRQYPTVKIGLTGLPVMENDEMRASQQATLTASAISLVGVACLFIAGFGGVRHPLMTVGALVLAIAWSFGYVTLSIGHLNILSMAFGLILIGLGIDFGVHYVACYLNLRQTNRDSAAALEQTAVRIGPGVVTGGVTTAIAFFTAGLTDFTGVAELGVIAGGGILLCIVSAMIVLPAMIYLADGRHNRAAMPRPLSVNRWLTPVHVAPRLTLAVCLAITCMLSLGLGSLWYDHNLLNLQPDGLESVELEEHLLAETDLSVWFALSIADSRDQLLRRKAAFESMDAVARTEEIVSLLPPDGSANASRIAQVEVRLQHLPLRPPQIPVDPPQELVRTIGTVQAALPTDNHFTRAKQQLAQAAHQLAQLPPAAGYQAVAQYQQRTAGELLDRLKALRDMADPRPPTFEDLPPSLVRRFVGQNGRHLLKVYGRSDIWDMAGLEEFVRQVRTVDPRATGKPLQTYEASRQMQRSYLHATLYALVAVTMVLVLDFGSLRYSLLALLPVSIGMLQLFGLLGLLDIPLNPANMIVLPLILGIGLDDGVHVIHDFRCQRGRYRLSRATATAVLITSLTTMVGFGSMMIAEHRGLASLGRVLTIGVSCCMFTSLVMLPAWLTWISRKRQDHEPGEGPTDLSAVHHRNPNSPTVNPRPKLVNS